MTMRRWTAVVLILLAVVVFGYDAAAIAFGGDEASFSAIINEAAYERSRSAFALGIIFGGLAVHLLGWSPTRKG